MRDFVRFVRTAVWLPFAALGNAWLMGALMLLLLASDPDGYMQALVPAIIVFFVCRGIARKIAPPPSDRHMRMPKDRVHTTSLVRLLKAKASATGAAVIMRRLSPPLRELLKRPADQKPAAVAFNDAWAAKRAARDEREVA